MFDTNNTSRQQLPESAACNCKLCKLTIQDIFDLPHITITNKQRCISCCSDNFHYLEGTIYEDDTLNDNCSITKTIYTNNTMKIEQKGNLSKMKNL